MGLLAVLAQDLGGQYVRNYAWQIRLVDPAAFMRKIGPVLERRLAGSMFAGLTDRVAIGHHGSTFCLVFREGILVAVVDPGPSDADAARIPPQTLVPLVLGYRSLDELTAAHHGANVPPRRRTLIRTLFPKTRSFIYTIY